MHLHSSIEPFIHDSILQNRLTELTHDTLRHNYIEKFMDSHGESVPVRIEIGAGSLHLAHVVRVLSHPPHTLDQLIAAARLRGDLRLHYTVRRRPLPEAPIQSKGKRKEVFTHEITTAKKSWTYWHKLADRLEELKSNPSAMAALKRGPGRALR